MKSAAADLDPKVIYLSVNRSRKTYLAITDTLQCLSEAMPLRTKKTRSLFAPNVGNDMHHESKEHVYMIDLD